MSARAWQARKDGGITRPSGLTPREERTQALVCRTVGCLLNRRPHVMHMIVKADRIPHWAYGTNRAGRRRARKSPPWGYA